MAFGDLTLLRLRHVIVFLLLFQSHRGQLQVTGSSQTIVALVGDDVTLPCRLEPATDASDVRLEWARLDLSPGFVYVRANGQERLAHRQPSYRGRTSVSLDRLKDGDVSLKLATVKVSDEGTYRCLVPALGRAAFINLVVGAASSPVIQNTKIRDRVVLQCESTGWYPEPEVFWLDGEGNLLSAGPTETVRGPDDLYTVSSRVTVEKRHSSSFTCRVQQSSINQTRETLIHVPVRPGYEKCVLVPGLISILLCIFLTIQRWRKKNKLVTEYMKSRLSFIHVEKNASGGMMVDHTINRADTRQTDSNNHREEVRAE